MNRDAQVWLYAASGSRMHWFAGDGAYCRSQAMKPAPGNPVSLAQTGKDPVCRRCLGYFEAATA